jgi:hypothetical protein
MKKRTINRKLAGWCSVSWLDMHTQKVKCFNSHICTAPTKQLIQDTEQLSLQKSPEKLSQWQDVSDAV